MSSLLQKTQQYTQCIRELHYLSTLKNIPDIKEMGDILLKQGMDENNDGFWIHNLVDKTSYYSPKLCESLGYSFEEFPADFNEWQKHILPKSLNIAYENLQHHIKSKGEHPYFQIVEYMTRSGEIIKIFCEGGIVSWHNNDPKIMIGTHKIIKD